MSLPRDRRVRVLAGDTFKEPNRGKIIRDLVSREILDRRLKGLAIYGAGHCERRAMGFPRELDDKYPGRIWSAFNFYDADEGRRVFGLGDKPLLVPISGTDKAKLPIGKMFFLGRYNDTATLNDITNAIGYYGDIKDVKVPFKNDDASLRKKRNAYENQDSIYLRNRVALPRCVRMQQVTRRRQR